MRQRLQSQVYKELLSYLRDPKARISLIVPPLLQLFVFAFAITLEVRNVDIAILDEDAGRWSFEAVARIGAAGFTDEILPVRGTAEMTDLLDRRRVLVGIRFSPDFSRDIEAGRTGEVQILADGRRANSGQIAVRYLDTILGGLADSDKGVRVVTRHAFNPNLIYRWFVVPGLAGILAMFLSLVVTALSIAREREMGTFDQLLVSPAKPLEIVAGKMVPAVLVGTVMALAMVAAGVFVFRIPFTGSPLLLLGSLIVFILSVVGVGLMISAISRTQQQAILGAFAVGVSTILISGFATPVENMPPWLQIVAEASPLKHFLIVVHGCFLKAMPAADVAANVWPMAVIAAFTLTLAVVFVRGRLQ